MTTVRGIAAMRKRTKRAAVFFGQQSLGSGAAWQALPVCLTAAVNAADTKACKPVK